MQLLLLFRALGNGLSAMGSTIPQSAMRRFFRRARGVVRVDDFDRHLSIELDLAEHMQRRIFWMGYYNLRLVAVLERILKPGMVVVDVGANIGEISMVCATRVGVKGRVIAFEPVAAIAEELERNLQRNALQSVVEVRRQGLADSAGQFNIYESCGQHDVVESHRGLGSLHGDPKTNRVLGLIDVVTLDEVVETLDLQRMDILKVDIEGGELPCLKGAMRALERFRPIVAVEVQERSARIAGYQGRDILDLLSPLGYRFHRLEEGGRLTAIDVDALTEYQDVICLPEEGVREVTEVR